MNGTRETLKDLGVMFLLVGICVLMLVHGIAKVRGYSDMSASFPDPIGFGRQLSLLVAIGSEVGCSLLLTVGAASRFAAVPLAFTMMVALFVVHGSDPWKVKELAAVYLLVYVSLILTGAGRFSIDHRWVNKRKATPAPYQN